MRAYNRLKDSPCHPPHLPLLPLPCMDTQLSMHACMHPPHTHTRARTHTRSHNAMLSHVRVAELLWAGLHAHAHPHTHTHTRARARTCACTRTRTHAHARSRAGAQRDAAGRGAALPAPPRAERGGASQPRAAAVSAEGHDRQLGGRGCGRLTW